MLSDVGSDVVVLIGGHTLEEALEAKESFDADNEGSEYADYIVCMDEIEWELEQDLSGEWAEQYVC